MSKFFIRTKEMGLNHSKITAAKIIVLALCLTIFASGYMCMAYSDDLNKGLSNNLIRLHIIANSDSPEDQALKRDVRDVILNYMKDKFTVSKNVDETKLLINKNMNEIEALAANEIKRQGKNYSVKAMLGNYPFPTKVYGDITLPAGNYEALRVVIGKGEGANWWCVLFPPLCFVDATHGTIPDSVKENLRNALTKEEYSIVTSTNNDEDIPIKVKFKIVEILQDSKLKFTGAVNRIFQAGQ
jgi:stage II sporulation protein R